MDRQEGIVHTYTTGAVHMRNQVQMGLNRIFSNFVVKKDRHVNPAETEYDEYDRIHGVFIDVQRRVVRFAGGEYEDKWDQTYGLSGRTGSERLFDAIDIILNRWHPEKGGSVAGFDDEEAGIFFTDKRGAL